MLGGLVDGLVVGSVDIVETGKELTGEACGLSGCLLFFEVAICMFSCVLAV